MSSSGRAGNAAVRLLFCAALLIVAPAAMGSGGRALVADDLFRIREVHEPQLSPDGAQLAYLVSHNDRDADEYRTALWMVGWEGGEPLQLTADGRDVSSPRFSPDGRYLSFLSASNPDAFPDRMLLLDRRGGEPYPLIRVTGAIASYAWSPDGRRIAVALRGALVPADAPAKAADDGGKAPPPIVIDGRHFKEDTEGYLTADSVNHLYLVEVASGRVTELTPEPGHSDDLPRWSPDGSLLAFVRTVERGTDADGREAIAVIEPRSGAVARQVTRIYAPNRQHLEWTPDGRFIALLQGLEPRLNAYISDRLALAPLGSGPLRPVGAALDRAVTGYAMAADGRAIDALIEDDRRIYPLHLPLDGSAPAPLLATAGVVTELAAAGGHLAVLLTTDQAAPEVYALERGQPRRLSHHNDALLAEVALGPVEDVSFRSRDGAEIHGLVVKPASFVAGHRYPTILWIHGGPDGEDEHSLLFDGYPLQFERQLLAAQGYVVLAVNYRGSSGRGSAFQQSIAGDWGHKEVWDLLAGIDRLVADGVADPARLGVGGWSYGGLLTDYTIATDHRFRAAISGAGSANQLALYGSDEYLLQENNEFGPPWRNPAAWLRVSYPFFHADRISTPTLFLGGEKDFNVPIIGGEQLYAALRTLGVPTRLVIYPGEYHILTRPSYIRDRAGRILDWYAQYLQPAAAPPAH